MTNDARYLKVEIQLDSLTQSARGAVFGEISVALDNSHFPEQKWNDFIVVVLGWWSGSCVALLRGAQQQEELWFMDGPFLMNMERAPDDLWRVRFLQLRAGPVPSLVRKESVPGLPDGVCIRPLSFVRSLTSSGYTVLHECARRGWATPDVEQLKRENSALRSLCGL
jgi:hypothetical protein